MLVAANRCLRLTALLWLVVCGPAWAAAPRNDPSASTIVDGVYENAYFGLRYPLPPDWTEGIHGPRPSGTGYYVLTTLMPQGEPTGTILITAQDMFFATRPFTDAVAMAADLSRAAAAIEGMTVDSGTAQIEIAGHVFGTASFTGAGLHHAVFVTEIRCHLVSVNLTSRDPVTLAQLVRSLDHLSLGASGAAAKTPICVQNYANDDTVLRRIEPVATGAPFAPVPVRIVIGSDGSVRSTHVIRASDAQRKSIEDALARWKFRPYEIDDHVAEVETGLRFQPGGERSRD